MNLTFLKRDTSVFVDACSAIAPGMDVGSKPMTWLLQALLLLAAMTIFCLPAVAQTAVDVPTWRYDNAHAGSNTQETLLTPANVNAAEFGLLFPRTVDGYVIAQPLYMSGLTMPDGLVHNVLFVATGHDSIYAFDADSNGGADAQPLWQASMLATAHGAAPGATTVPSKDVSSYDITPEIGITGTPVINPGTNTMYVVAKSKESGTYVQRLHAINILTGAEQPNSPVVIQASVSGTGNGSSGGSLAFSPLWQSNRPALSYYNGYVYASFGSHGDNGPWHGWIFSFDANTLAQKAAVCLSSSGFGNGIWAAGAAMPIDSGGTAGRLFLVTGNGTYSSYPPFSPSVNFGDSVVEFDLANGGLKAADAFTPFNQASLSAADTDQGSGGILMLPDQQGSFPHILIQVGKEGRILNLNRDNLGGFLPNGSSNTNALQDIPGKIKGLWSTPAFWNGNVYTWGNGDVAKSFVLNSGVLSPNFSSKGSVTSAFPGASFTISSNGDQDGIAWAVRSDSYKTNGPEILYAFDATNLGSILYESDTKAARDTAGGAIKFAVPVVTNGKVYLGAAYQVDTYGLLTTEQAAAAPVIHPNGGTISPGTQITLTSATPSANIYYTLDGSTPTTGSTLYAGGFTLDTAATVKAVASASNYLESSVTSAVFTLTSQTPPPVFAPAPGTYSSAQQVTLADADSSAALYYSTDGSTPSSSSQLYAGSIPVSSSTTIRAVAIDPALQNSNVVSSSYVIQAGGTTINFGNGFSSVAGLTLNGSTKNSDDSRLQLTEGGQNQAGSVFYSQPINVQAFTTDFAFQLSNAVADGFTFTIQNTAATALGAYGSGLGYGGIKKSVAVKFDLYSNAGEGTDSTGIYANGATPTVPFVDMTSSGLVLRSGDSMQAHLTYDGTTLTMLLTDGVSGKSFTLSQAVNIPQIIGSSQAWVGFTGSTGGLSSSQKILSWTYTAQASPATTAPPVFTPAGGTYAAPQNVTISDATANAVIHYTTDGSTPGTSSPVYGAALQVGAGTTTIRALAMASGASPSSMVSAVYTVTGTSTPAPVFNPAGGTYSSAQSVTLSDSASNATIYYTTDGSTPVSTSPVYSGPISVSASETITAIAAAAGLSPSQAVAAAYTIQSGAPAIDFENGFSGATGLALNGTATLSGAALQLAKLGQTYAHGSAWYATPVNIASFTTDFNFQLLSAQADGLTFTLQSFGTRALGPAGSGLGYGASQPGGTGGIAKSVAMKFDLYSNDGEGTDSTGFYVNGASPTTPALNMAASGVTLRNGHVFHAHLTYDGSRLTLLLTDIVTSASYTATETVNLPAVLGSSMAYAGFTSGTGGLTGTFNILNWTLSAGVSQTARAATTLSGGVAGNEVTTYTRYAAEPGFTPTPGEHAGAVSVELLCNTPGNTVYYTVDGSQPTRRSAIYRAPIVVNGRSLIIKAFSTAPGRRDSAVVTGTYQVKE